MTVWTGKDMLIFGGSGTSGTPSDGAAYDPATNTWRKLAPIPASLGGNLTGSGSYAVWTGKVMVAWGFFGNGGGSHGGGSLAAATYNPAANSWTTGKVAPAQAPLFGDAFWTGKQMIVWGSSPVSPVILRATPTTQPPGYGRRCQPHPSGGPGATRCSPYGPADTWSLAGETTEQASRRTPPRTTQ